MSFQVRRVRRNDNPMLGGIIMIVMGVGLAFILSRTLLADAAESQTWPSVTGQVVTSEVKSQRSGDSNSYSARVIYEYQVDDELYTGGKISVADGSSSRSARARNIIEQYPEGSSVDVFYNPDLPEDALLQPGAPWFLNWLYWGGILFAIIGAWALLRSIFRLIFGFLR